MTDETRNDLQSVASIVGATGALLAVGIIASKLAVGVPPVRSVTIQFTPSTIPGTITEVWSSTNLATWSHKTNVTGTNRITVRADKPAEFFIARSKLPLIETRGTNTITNWYFSPWSRRGQ